MEPIAKVVSLAHEQKGIECELRNFNLAIARLLELRTIERPVDILYSEVWERCTAALKTSGSGKALKAWGKVEKALRRALEEQETWEVASKCLLPTPQLRMGAATQTAEDLEQTGGEKPRMPDPRRPEQIGLPSDERGKEDARSFWRGPAEEARVVAKPPNPEGEDRDTPPPYAFENGGEACVQGGKEAVPGGNGVSSLNNACAGERGDGATPTEERMTNQSAQLTFGPCGARTSPSRRRGDPRGRERSEPRKKGPDAFHPSPSPSPIPSPSPSPILPRSPPSPRPPTELFREFAAPLSIPSPPAGGSAPGARRRARSFCGELAERTRGAGRAAGADARAALPPPPPPYMAKHSAGDPGDGRGARVHGGKSPEARVVADAHARGSGKERRFDQGPRSILPPYKGEIPPCGRQGKPRGRERYHPRREERGRSRKKRHGAPEIYRQSTSDSESSNSCSDSPEELADSDDSAICLPFWVDTESDVTVIPGIQPMGPVHTSLPMNSMIPRGQPCAVLDIKDCFFSILLHKTLHIGAKALAKKCGISTADAKHVVATCPHCQKLPLWSSGVNPRGLKASEASQETLLCVVKFLKRRDLKRLVKNQKLWKFTKCLVRIAWKLQPQPGEGP
ncbi:serine/arginine repetitive matrix protein 1-like [Serinus canaria]|uniref:serine/arginine repetitive matrix protein 1-like n=1 Tax=Serinus canaria TaxID=9135 RepID=UPI0021CCD9D8|nr:serine/arginine repetitive matrix protein 1-like [Serinus canaria]